MKEKKVIAVTGANGYIGKHVVDALILRDAEVIAVDRAPSQVNQRARFVQMDIFSGNRDIFKLLGSPDVCLHLAWRNVFSHNADSHMLELSKHYEFIKNVIDGGLNQVAVIGSMHEVGNYCGAVDENTPCNPTSMYGIAKDSLRKSVLLLAQMNSITAQWLRVFYIYGDDRHNQSVFTSILQAEENGKESFLLSSGNNRYDFIHVDELSHMIAACIMQEEISGIINCCSGQPVRLAEKVDEFIKDNYIKLKLESAALADKPYDFPEIWGDNTKISKLLLIQKRTAP